MNLYRLAGELSKRGQKPTALAADLGINVLYASFQSIKGITFSLGEYRFIIIDSELPEDQQEIVCGHEIAHFLLHPKANYLFILNYTFYYPSYEYQANRFCMEMFVGKEQAEQYACEISEAASRGDLEEMSRLVTRLIEEGCDF